MTRLLSLRAGAAVAIALTAVAAHAGRDCDSKPLTTDTLDRGLQLAQRTARYLDSTGARVAVLARAGQDLSRYGLRYSHLGFAYRETGSGVWRVVHKLNHCDSAQADLYRQGLGQFFLDDLHRYEAGVVLLAPALQERLLPLLQDPSQLARLHTPAYNMLAYPWSGRYQQSNQWAIETLAFAADTGADSRERAQAWLRLKDYRPTQLRLGTFTRLGARATRANIAFDDHPGSQRYSGRIETVTVDSVFEWLPRAGLGTRVATVD
ncbi:DUF2145 domain-containing protein [Caldimonas brevitalea]|uniref:Membrane protein n=1 Tax=Caldimonas brevitalea TaxID=413882 RepID=A0A0G3BXL7_9BURK|nr:DUF2145 domain-containing protein [Caldimonas brevitalea]AKJ32121.1 membrane protein [Caldimonas brevitalea]